MKGAGLRDLTWLAAVELRNRVLGMAARLKDPRYLIAFLVGAAYFVLIFAPTLFRGDAAMEAPSWAASIAPVALAGLVLFWWVRGGYQEALAFRPEEVHFLFPAPIDRTTLIRYKLLRAQPGVLLSALLVGLFRPGAAPWYMTLPAAYLLVATLHLHQVGASLVRVTATRRGGGLRRVAVPVALAGALGIVLVWTLARAIRAARAAESIEAAGAAAMAALTSPLAEAALLPFRLLLSPLLAESAGAWALGMVAALGLLALHVLWVHRTDAAFEEGAAEAGRKRARRVAAARAGKAWWRAAKEEDAVVRRWVRPPLDPTGEPAAALTWSHMLGFMGDIRLTTLAIIGLSGLAVFGTMVWGAGSLMEAAMGAAAMAGMLALMAFVFGPLVMRYDLRRDLERIDLLRSYPVSPPWLIAAEVATPVILLTAIEMVLLAAALGLLLLAGLPGDVLAQVAAAALFLAVNTPGLLTLQLGVQNGLALLFPGWVRIGGTGRGGIDAVGQGIISTLAALLLFVALVLPPAIAALLVSASYGPVMGGWAAVPGAVAFTAAVWLEAFWLVRWLARVYDGLDPVEAGLVR